MLPLRGSLELVGICGTSLLRSSFTGPWGLGVKFDGREAERLVAEGGLHQGVAWRLRYGWVGQVRTARMCARRTFALVELGEGGR